MHAPLSLDRPRFFNVDRELVFPIAVGYALGIAAAVMLALVTDMGTWLYGLLVVLTMSFFLGKWLGETVWPVLGLRASQLAIRIHLRGRDKGAILHLTPYQDFPSNTIRKAAESTALATGLAVIFAGSLTLLANTPSSRTLVAWSFISLALASTLSFSLVPRWLFSRLGARIENRSRFIVRSLAEEHGRIMRVSDGAIILFALFFGVNVLSQTMDRLEGGLVVTALILALASVSVVTMSTGAAYFARHETQLVRRLHAHAKRLGFAEMMWRQPL